VQWISGDTLLGMGRCAGQHMSKRFPGMTGPRRALLAVAGLAWVSAILFGARTLWNYETGPGEAGRAPSVWPSRSSIVPSPGRFTLVMLAHPDCPCTGASLVELERLMGRAQPRINAFVVFGKPGTSRADIEASSLWTNAAQIPGVTVQYDGSGAEARIFGAAVSGQTMLYRPDGRLAFSGGITLSRGHQADNPGEESVIRIVNGDSQESAGSPVFGCSMRDPTEQELKAEPSWQKR
jgi:hypothetical protein